MSRLLGLFVAAITLVLLGTTNGNAGGTANPMLFGTVGPAFTITLKDASGAAVTHLDSGTYDIQVSDQSDIHNFHLLGPGVDKSTDVVGTGTVTWTVTLTDGTYTYFCDPHSATLHGSFTVGVGATPEPTPTPTPTGAISPRTPLVLKVGPGFTITLKPKSGRSFTAMRRGTYTIAVKDLSSIHDAHLIAPGGVSKRTGIAFVGTVVWRVKLAKVGTLRFRCDPHAATMHGSRKIV
jgi:hypothetical protein